MSNSPDDDLFKESTMTFGEHIEELRTVLFRSLIGVVICMLISLPLASKVVELIQSPLRKALTDYYQKQAEDKLAKEYDVSPKEILNTIELEGMAPEVMHLERDSLLEGLASSDSATFGEIQVKPYQFVLAELPEEKTQKFAAWLSEEGKLASQTPGQVVYQAMDRSGQTAIDSVANAESVGEEDRLRVISALNGAAENPAIWQSEAFTKITKEELLAELKTGLEAEFDVVNSRRLNRLAMSQAFEDYLTRPRLSLVAITVWRETEVHIQALSAHEAFMIWLKAALIVGVLISSPWIFWNIWQFVAAGLYPHERGYVYIYLPFSMLLFIAGAALAFFFVFEPVLKFLFSFNAAMKIDPDPRIGEWISFVLFLPLGFGLAFQLPLVMLFINRLGIFSVEAFLSKWRIAILVIFVLSMFLTPADPISMMLLAGPLTILYFLGIALCQWMPHGRNPFNEVYEP